MAKKPASKPDNRLESALDFIAPVMVEDGNPNQKFCIVHDKKIVVSDGVISMCHPIDEDFSICPVYFPLKAAIKKSKDKLAITIKDNDTLSIVSGKLKAIVPCINYRQLFLSNPDLATLPINNNLKEGFDKLGFIMKEESDRIIEKSILLASGSMVATNGQLLLEYWHGAELPTLVIPKRFINIVSKVKLPLLSCGYSKSSVTFYFENGAWIKTSLFADQWPSLAPILSVPTEPLSPVPAGLGEALEAVLPHSPDDAVYFGEGVLWSHPLDSGDTGAAFDVPGLAAGPIFNGKLLGKVLELATRTNFAVPYRDAYMLAFVGTNIRGFLMPRTR